MGTMNGSFGYECDDCGVFRIYSVEGSSDIDCASCNKKLGTVSNQWSLEDSCPFCDCKSYYKRKDFNQILGAGIILTGAILSIIYNYFILMGFALLDILLYKIVPDVAVCYQCSVELRGFHGMDKLEVFDHHTAELYHYSASEES
jgi:phage FluMu protein Com